MRLLPLSLFFGQPETVLAVREGVLFLGPFTGLPVLIALAVIIGLWLLGALGTGFNLI